MGVTGDPKSRVLRPSFKQITAVRAGVANHLDGEIHEYRDYTVAAVAVLVCELVGALRGTMSNYADDGPFKDDMGYRADLANMIANERYQ